MTAVPQLPEVIVAMLERDRSLAGPGIEVLSADGGQALARLTIRADQVNGHGRVHGGLVFMLADTALACAANSVLAPALTAGAEVLFLDGAVEAETMLAQAAVRSTVGRTAVIDVTVRCGERIVAEVRGRAVQVRSG